jgi:DNA invertase Pin-like site-specific DNA recombinase
MSVSECIQARHLSRLAVIYVRQSSPHQTFANQESLKLQYDLSRRAQNYGWGPDRIRTIDTDLGRSGRTVEGRPGFQELVTLVTLEQVGILFAYDVTRLARNCTDWYQLLDLCGHRGCLVGDQDGIYDPATPNGRLILGLKGLISELELHTLRRRMTDGLLNKARRGELAQHLPVGLVRDALGRVVKRPDQEVQNRLDLVFATFLRLRSVHQVVRFFNSQDLRVPRLDHLNDVVWRPATTSSICSILDNPAYAGAFVHGRTRTVPRVGSGSGKTSRRVPREEWPIQVLDKYPAYIDWETFEKIQAMLHDNYSEYRRQGSRGVPRSGKALLHGILYCGECGHKLAVRYASWPHYTCIFVRNKYRVGSECLRVPIAPVDQAVAQAFLEALTPAELDLYAQALTLLQQENEQVQQARHQQLERLRYQARLAERQFNRADPDNRLVTAELERRWEAALRELKAAEEGFQREQQQQRVPVTLDAETRRAFAEAGEKIPDLWRQDRLSAQQKKALVRCLIDKVVVQRPTPDVVQLRIVWKGGDTTTTDVPVTVGSWTRVARAAELEEAIVQLARQGKSDTEIAEELTRRGYRSPRQLTVTPGTVHRVRRAHGLFVHAGFSHPRRVPGYLTVPQVAHQLKVQPSWIYARIQKGVIHVQHDPKWKVYLFPNKAKTISLFKQFLAGKLQELRF